VEELYGVGPSGSYKKGGRKYPPSPSSFNIATLIDLSQAPRARRHTEQEPETRADGN